MYERGDGLKHPVWRGCKTKLVSVSPEQLLTCHWSCFVSGRHGDSPPWMYTWAYSGLPITQCSGVLLEIMRDNCANDTYMHIIQCMPDTYMTVTCMLPNACQLHRRSSFEQINMWSGTTGLLHWRQNRNPRDRFTRQNVCIYYDSRCSGSIINLLKVVTAAISNVALWKICQDFCEDWISYKWST